MKNSFAISIGIFIVVAIFATGFNYSAKETPASPSGMKVEKLSIVSGANGKTHTFDVEIADTPSTRATGLMHREKMGADHGMLFEMEGSDVVRFWMKDTLIPLDMLFIGANGVIKTIHDNAIPHDVTSISSQLPVAAVLELNGGRAEALGIEAGDKVVHPFFSEDKK